MTAAQNLGEGGGRAVVQAHSNPSSAANAQRARLLAHLQQHGAMTTLDARRDLDVLHPAMRILELRKQGYDIRMVWVEQHTACGKLHRVGQYYLVPRVQA